MQGDDGQELSHSDEEYAALAGMPIDLREQRLGGSSQLPEYPARRVSDRSFEWFGAIRWDPIYLVHWRMSKALTNSWPFFLDGLGFEGRQVVARLHQLWMFARAARSLGFGSYRGDDFDAFVDRHFDPLPAAAIDPYLRRSSRGIGLWSDIAARGYGVAFGN